MIRALAVGFGLAIASATVMFACGGDDSGSTGGAGTTSNGTAGNGASGRGTAGTNGTSGGGGTVVTGGGGTVATGGSAGTLSPGVGGAFDLDGGFDFDAFFGTYTCAQLTACCATVPVQARADCNMFATGGDEAKCSAAMTGYKLAGLCK